MSSILEALKKAEQESTMDRSANTPWPAPLPMQSRYRKRSRRWWVLLGTVVGLCVAGVVRWQVRQPDMTRPADSMPALPSQSLPKPYHGVPPPVAEEAKPGVPIAEQPQTPPGKTLIDASPRQATGNAPASKVQAEKQPLRQTAVSTSVPLATPAADPALRPAETAVTSQPVAAHETDKRFRSDPRIDLQALVWAPDSAGRFVVINNRLIKEGGSLDNIVVVRINPDDVLLAEGSDRWHEEFKIR